MTYAGLMRELTSSSDKDVKSAVAKTCGFEPENPIIERLEWLGLFEEKEIPSGISTILDSVCNLFEEKMQYTPGERDMIVMHHEFLVQYPDKKQKVTSTLIDYGIPNGNSSMSRTVALPVAIASKMILDGEITLTGVHRPIIPEIYEPILKELESLDIKMNEKTINL
jgi:saccharopine dehydrogenase-like NADP-dependent oxidoreductase